MIRHRTLVRALIAAGAGLFLLHAFTSIRSQTCPIDTFAPADLYPCGEAL